MPRTTGEKIVALETQMTDIQNNISEIQSDIKEIKKAIVPTVQENSHRISRLEKQTGLMKWITPIVASVLTAVVTFLVIAYLDKV